MELGTDKLFNVIEPRIGDWLNFVENYTPIKAKVIGLPETKTCDEHSLIVYRMDNHGWSKEENRSLLEEYKCSPFYTKNLWYLGYSYNVILIPTFPYRYI